MAALKHLPRGLWIMWTFGLMPVAFILMLIWWFIYGALLQHYAEMNNFLIFLSIWMTLVATNTWRMLQVHHAKATRLAQTYHRHWEVEIDNVQVAFAQLRLQSIPGWEDWTADEFADWYHGRTGEYPIMTEEKLARLQAQPRG